jgi:hypothetical protein
MVVLYARAYPEVDNAVAGMMLKKPGEGFALDPLGPAAPNPDSLSKGF